MPAERIEIPAPLLKWFNDYHDRRGRDWLREETGLATATISEIRRSGTASPSVIGKIERARLQDPAVRRPISYRHAVEVLRHLVELHPTLSPGGIGPGSRERIIAMVGLEVLDEMAVKADLLPPIEV